MTRFTPEITTTVKVNINTDGIDEGIKLIHGDRILSSCMGEIANHLEAKKQELNAVADPLALAVSKNLQSHQEQIISMKHYKTGMMRNSVDITKDGNAQYLVGNTASSVDGFPYPLAIDKGSKAHWIAPVTFHALHWVKNGTDYFSKGHMVSGIKADPFVEPSINMTDGDIESVITSYLGKILK